MRFATKRCSSGWTVRSFFATMYQLGFDLQAVPSTFWSKRSAAGAKWVAQTSFCSSSERSPAKQATPPGRIQTPVRDFDVREDVCSGELILLALRRLALVRGEGGDVDQPGDAVIGSRGRDQGSTVRVADEDGRIADTRERAGDRRDVACERVEAVLARHHLVPLRLKRGEHLAE